jgi:hypothetical protein
MSHRAAHDDLVGHPLRVPSFGIVEFSAQENGSFAGEVLKVLIGIARA